MSNRNLLCNKHPPAEKLITILGLKCSCVTTHIDKIISHGKGIQQKKNLGKTEKEEYLLSDKEVQLPNCGNKRIDEAATPFCVREDQSGHQYLAK